jgi:hypothetical protein
MIVEVPEGVTTGGGARLALLLVLAVPQPAARITEQRKTAVTAPLHDKRLARRSLSNVQRFLAAFTKTRASARSRSKRIPAGGAKRLGGEGSTMALPLVDTVTVNGAAAPFETETVGGT